MNKSPPFSRGLGYLGLNLVGASFFWASLVFSGCTPKPHTINGQVFIVTQGGSNIKLGLVDVQAFRLSTLQPIINRKNEQISEIISKDRPRIDEAVSKHNAHNTLIEKAMAEHGPVSQEDFEKLSVEKEYAQRLQNELSRNTSPEVYFAELPAPPLASAKTDSDGKFTMSIPTDDKIVFVAKATRSVGKETERYYWMVGIKWTKGNDAESLLLSNDNLASNIGSISLGSLFYAPLAEDALAN